MRLQDFSCGKLIDPGSVGRACEKNFGMLMEVCFGRDLGLMKDLSVDFLVRSIEKILTVLFS